MVRESSLLYVAGSRTFVYVFVGADVNKIESSRASYDILGNPGGFAHVLCGHVSTIPSFKLLKMSWIVCRVTLQSTCSS